MTLKAPGLCPQRRYFDTNPGAKSNVPLEPSSSNSTVCRYSALRRLMLEERGGRAPRERSSGRNAMLGVDRRGGNYRAGPAEFLRGICRESMTNVVLPGHQSTSRQPPRPRQKHCSGTQQRQRPPTSAIAVAALDMQAASSIHTRRFKCCPPNPILLVLAEHRTLMPHADGHPTDDHQGR